MIFPFGEYQFGKMPNLNGTLMKGVLRPFGSFSLKASTNAKKGPIFFFQ
jgi:hypothetical protein